MKNNIYIIFIFCIFCFSSCTERIDIDTDEMEEKVSIFGELDASKNRQSVTIYKTAPYFSKDDNMPVEDATVTIISQDNQVWNLSYVNDGKYESDNNFIPEVGKKYYLNVVCDYNGDGIKDEFKSSTQIPEAVTLDSVKFIKDKMIYDIYNVTIYCGNVKNQRYCLYKFYNNDELVTPQLSDWQCADIEFWNTTDYIDGLFCYLFYDEKDLDSFSDDEKDDYIFVSPNDKVTIELSLIDKGYYNFISQCQTELHGENPIFGGPAANIITNIDNGAYGYWGAVNYVKRSNIIP